MPISRLEAVRDAGGPRAVRYRDGRGRPGLPRDRSRVRPAPGGTAVVGAKTVETNETCTRESEPLSW